MLFTPRSFKPPVAVLLLLAQAGLSPAADTVPAGAVYHESGGIVVMEAERTPSSLGSGSDRWEARAPGDANFVDGATDGAHLEFLGNSSNGGDPEIPLTYTFRIHEAGYYHLHLRARARLDGAPADKNNDCYVKVAGLDGATFGAGPDAGGSHMDDAPLTDLKKDTKMYGGLPNGWGWANLLDLGGSSNKRWPVYQFNANSTYRLTLSGRSIKFNLDRIVFRKSTIADTSAKAASIPESALEENAATSPAVTRIMIVDAGTDRDLGELTDGGTINLATAGPGLNLRVDTSPPVIGSVRFALDGDDAYHTDLAAPYSIGGDNIWDDYLPWTPAPGNHTLTVTPFSTGGATGTPVTLNFSVIDQLPAGSPVANAGTDRTITLPTESTALAGSGGDSGGSIAAYRWDQTAGPSVATFSSRAAAAPTVSDLTVGSYRFRLTVTDDSGLTGFDEVDVTVAPATGSLAVNAGPDQVVTLPASSVTLNGSASDPGGVSDFRLWTQLSGPSNSTRSGETSFNLTASDLVEGTYVFRLRLFDGSELVGADDVTVTVTSAAGLPIASAGPDKSITLPVSSVVLGGSGSDPGGSISSYAWIQVSGPSAASLSGHTTANLTASGLVQGGYLFRLTVTDNSGLTASDDAFVTVSPASGTPVANAGPDKSITLPASSVVLNGSGSDPGGSITSHGWIQVSGPSTASLSGHTTANLTASNLAQGVYRFRLTVTDNDGLTANDDAFVTVNAAGGSGQAVTTLTLVNADTDQDIGPINNGDTIDFAVTGSHLNIRADTSPSAVGSVRFSFAGEANYATQSGAPYTIGGDSLNDYWVWTPPLGPQVLTATPFTSSGGSGVAGTPLTVSFTIIDSSTGDGISGFAPPTIERLAGDQVRVTFRGVPGRNYTLQRSISLAGWSDLQTLPAEPDGSVEFTDPAAPAGNAFYRLETP